MKARIKAGSLVFGVMASAATPALGQNQPAASGAKDTAAPQLSSMLQPIAVLRSEALLYDSASRPNVTFGTSHLRLGATGTYEAWQATLELETVNLPANTSRSMVRQAYIGRDLTYVDAKLGRLLPDTVLTNGEFYRQNPVDDDYGSADGLRVGSQLGPVRLDLTLGNSLGTTAIATDEAIGTTVADLYSQEIGARKEGYAGSVRAVVKSGGISLGLWYGYERNRVVALNTPSSANNSVVNLDGKAYHTYADIQASLAYTEMSWAVHADYRRTSRSATLNTALLPSGHVVSDPNVKPGDGSRQDLWSLGAQARYLVVGRSDWRTAFDLVHTATSTDNLTLTQQGLEDRKDSLLYALSQVRHEGPFEASLNLYEANTRGKSYPDRNGKIGASNHHLTVFLRVSADLDSSAHWAI